MKAELLTRPALAFLGLTSDDVSPKAIRALTECFPGAQWFPAGVVNDVATSQGRKPVEGLAVVIGIEAPQPEDFLSAVSQAIPGLLFWTGDQVEVPLALALSAGQPDGSPTEV